MYCAEYYKTYLEAKRSKEKEKSNDAFDTRSKKSEISAKDENTNVEATIEQFSLKDPVKNKLDGIEDNVVRELIKDDLECLLRGLPNDIKDLRILLENLSKWNEYIERTEAEDIANFGLASLVELDLSVFASIKHEVKNTKVALIRRMLEKLSDKYTLLEHLHNSLKNDSENTENSAIELITVLQSYYKKPENKKSAIIARMAALNAKKEIKVLKKKGLFLAISKIPTPLLFVVGIAALFSGFPPLQIIGAGISGLAISRVVKIPSILMQFHIGKKALPNADFASVQTTEKHYEESEKIEHETGINLEKIRGYSIRGLRNVCGCCLGQNLPMLNYGTTTATTTTRLTSVSGSKDTSPEVEEKSISFSNEEDPIIEKVDMFNGSFNDNEYNAETTRLDTSDEILKSSFVDSLKEYIDDNNEEALIFFNSQCPSELQIKAFAQAIVAAKVNTPEASKRANEAYPEDKKEAIFKEAVAICKQEKHTKALLKKVETIKAYSETSEKQIGVSHEVEEISISSNEENAKAEEVSTPFSIFGTNQGFFNMGCTDPKCTDDKCAEESDDIKEIRAEMARRRTKNKPSDVRLDVPDASTSEQQEENLKEVDRIETEDIRRFTTDKNGLVSIDVMGLSEDIPYDQLEDICREVKEKLDRLSNNSSSNTDNRTENFEKETRSKTKVRVSDIKTKSVRLHC